LQPGHYRNTNSSCASQKKLILKEARLNYCLGEHLSRQAVSFSIPVTVPLEVESISIIGEVLRPLTKPLQGIQEFDLEPRQNFS
jgi:hypothetical protein